MEILYTIVVGLVVGAVARLLMPGRDPVGLIGTLLIGVVGAFIGTFAWEAIFGEQEDTAWIGAIIVAMVLLGIYRSMTYRRHDTTVR